MRQLLSVLMIAVCLCARVSAAEPAATSLRFVAQGEGFSFNTGLLRGTLRADGHSNGLKPVFLCETGQQLVNERWAFGLANHYRLLGPNQRYLPDTREWASTATVLDDGAVEARWSADAEHPFDQQVIYRWHSPGELDIVTQITPKQNLPRFESFLASYFSSLDQSFAFVAPCEATDGKADFLEVKEAGGRMQFFPRDDAARQLATDGRWKLPPHPLDWGIGPRYAAPLGMRRDRTSGVTALAMARPEECAAIEMPYGEEMHRALYLSLFGRDLAAGEKAVAQARLVIGNKISNAEAITAYERFLQDTAPAAQ